MASILITGASGFLGTRLSEVLLEAGSRVVAIDVAPPSRPSKSPEYIVTMSDVSNLGDLLDIVKTNRISAIVHLAALLAEADQEPSKSIGPNYVSTLNVLEAARILDVPRVLFASSIAVYGKRAGPKTDEDRIMSLPNTNYGVSKVFGEVLGRIYAKRYGIDFRAVRLPFVVGGEISKHHIMRFVVDMIESALNGDECILEYPFSTRFQLLYIEDAVGALMRVLKAKGAPSRTYNVPGFRTSVGKLVTEVRRQFPEAKIRLKVTENGKRAAAFAALFPLTMNGKRIAQEIGWAPIFNLSAMVKDIAKRVRQVE